MQTTRTPLFKEQFDKIITAYFKGTLKPFSQCNCFVGNLLNNNKQWAKCRHLGGDTEEIIERIRAKDKNYSFAESNIKKESNGLYNRFDIIRLEKNFLLTYIRNGKNEEALFEAMSSTLDVLKEIHRSKGEVIEEIVVEKRKLVA